MNANLKMTLCAPRDSCLSMVSGLVDVTMDGFVEQQAYSRMLENGFIQMIKYEQHTML